jgi:hypothetical protein
MLPRIPSDHLELGGDGIIQLPPAFAPVNGSSMCSLFHGSVTPFFGIKIHDNGVWPWNLTGFVTQLLCGAFASPVIGMLFAPLLDAYHIGRTAPVIPIYGLRQPALVAGDFASLLAPLLGAETLVKGGFWIRREPLMAAGTDFSRMLFLHPAFSPGPFRSQL